MAIFLKSLYRDALKKSLYQPIVEEWANSAVYFTTGRTKEWSGGPFNPDEETGRYDQVEGVRNDLICGVRVKPDDVAFVAKKNVWQSNVVYSTYINDVANRPFHVVNSTNDIYKCISNNNKKRTSEEPKSIAKKGVFTTADGYVWKYMGTLDANALAKFGTSSLIPLQDTPSITGNTVPGTIDVISVVNPGSGYLRYATGRVGAKVSNAVVRVEGISDEATGYYANCSFAITGGTGIGRVYTITTSVSNSLGKFLTLSTTNAIVDGTSQYVVAPRLIVNGDGNNAVGYVNVSNGAVTNVVMANVGINFSYANVYCSSDIGVNAVFKPHISPPGGHGSDIVEELESSGISLSAEFTKDLEEALPDNITYYQFAMLKSPKTTANTFITTDVVRFMTKIRDASNTIFRVGERIKGLESEAQGVVHSSNSTGTYLKSVRGSFISGEFITSNSSGANVQLNYVGTSDFDRNSGKILYYSDVAAINRTDTVISEKIRCTINFEG